MRWLPRILSRSAADPGAAGLRTGGAGNGGPSPTGPATRTGDASAPSALRDAERLVEAGRLVHAVAALSAANRAQRDPALEVRLVELRHRAACETEPGPGRSPWPPVYEDPFPDVVGRLPEVPVEKLDREVLGGAVAHHGCLVVRGLFDPDRTARTVDAIHRTAEARDREPPADDDMERAAWYRPFPPTKGLQQTLRDMVTGQGGSWLADSPASTALVLDDLESVGVIDAITEHLGERPFFSLQKSTLRRSPPINKLTGWHQDGSFLGPEVRTMNVWVALSRCGGDYPAPGMSVVPKRLDLLPTDSDLTSASVSEATVLAAAGDTPVIRPEFAPGDAMLFDERFLHCTYLSPDLTEPRYALECWFFAPSHNAPEYVPFWV